MSDYVEERTVTEMHVGVSRTRRILVTAFYCVLVFVAAGLVPAPYVSDDCLLYDQCTRQEDRALGMTGMGMRVGFGAAIVLGWRVKLPGARPRPSAPDLAALE